MNQFTISKAIVLSPALSGLRQDAACRSRRMFDGAENHAGLARDAVFPGRTPLMEGAAFGEISTITRGLQTRLTDAQLGARPEPRKQKETSSPSHAVSKYSQAEDFRCFGTRTQSRGMAEKQCNADV